jgi:hypothetical protein
VAPSILPPIRCMWIIYFYTRFTFERQPFLHAHSRYIFVSRSNVYPKCRATVIVVSVWAR